MRPLPILCLSAVLCSTLACSTTSTTASETPASPETSGLTGLVDEATFKALHELSEAEVPPLRGETVELAGTQAYLSLPEGASGPLPAIVVIHEWWGLNDHIRHWTDRLAEDGYAALAVDLYAGEVATTPDEAMALMKAHDPEAAARTLAAAHDYLAADPRIRAQKRGVIGWCFGGGWSLQHAIATPDLDAAVIYYGHLVEDPAQLAEIDAELMGVFGDQDPGIPPEAVAAFATQLEAAGKTIEVHSYDAVHAFANPSNAKYDQEAASDAWGHVRAFFDRTLR